MLPMTDFLTSLRTHRFLVGEAIFYCSDKKDRFAKNARDDVTFLLSPHYAQNFWVNSRDDSFFSGLEL
jgi:hypothetical protein